MLYTYNSLQNPLVPSPSSRCLCHDLLLWRASDSAWDAEQPTVVEKQQQKRKAKTLR